MKMHENSDFLLELQVKSQIKSEISMSYFYFRA